MRPFTIDAPAAAATRPNRLAHRVHLHHAHWVHEPISRRGFIGGAAAAGGALLGSSVLRPAMAFAHRSANATPKPIPGGIQPGGPGTPVFHLLLPTPQDRTVEPATITDFKGLVGHAQVQGTGTASEPDGTTRQLLFDVDQRFMKGVFVGQDGELHHGTFGFV